MLARSPVPWLAPLAPLALAAMVLAWHETRTSPVDIAPVGSHPCTRPVMLPPLEIVGRRFPVAPGSEFRVRIGTAPNDVWVCARAIDGTLCLGVDAVPERLEVKVELESLRREDSGPARQLSWDILGTQRHGSLSFHGTRDTATRTAVPGVSKVSFRGTMQVGSVTRHVTVPLWFSRMPNNGIRVLGRGHTTGSEYGLPGRRGTTPFSGDEPLVVVWDLVF